MVILLITTEPAELANAGLYPVIENSYIYVFVSLLKLYILSFKDDKEQTITMKSWVFMVNITLIDLCLSG